MRFKDYLLERFDPAFDEDKFKEECAFYFEQMNGRKLLMLHGTDEEVIPGKRLSFRQRDKPRDSNENLHDLANDLMEEKFGKPFRNGLFVTGKKSFASEFGRNTAFIVPIGKFEWLSSPDIRDLTFVYTRHLYKNGIPLDYSLKLWNKEAGDATLEDMKKARWYHNMDLPKCLEGLSETMLWCPAGFYTFTYGNLPRSLLA